LRGTPKNLLKTAIFGPPEASSPLLQHPFSSLFLSFPPFSSISEAPANSGPPRFVRGWHRLSGHHKSAIPNPCVGSEPPEGDATGVSSPFLQEPVSVPGNEIPRRAHGQARPLG